jgi:hypothetical protein
MYRLLFSPQETMNSSASSNRLHRQRRTLQKTRNPQHNNNQPNNYILVASLHGTYKKPVKNTMEES